eukprot:CAMPEP_0119308876 /NCGR_PEP_ID=MMETSP1333-20130426/12821_1 /TAXON_ID=418940 /ORGANISM="Scyphosphaera apsteinii, Strain RCC1455" /LENGTH=149 /DNA_ID=CAMNT_0007312749 /DNA_START=207 /DNA_END=657 /DNA_ORIENTATION=-
MASKFTLEPLDPESLEHLERHQTHREIVVILLDTFVDSVAHSVQRQDGERLFYLIRQLVDSQEEDREEKHRRQHGQGSFQDVIHTDGQGGQPHAEETLGVLGVDTGDRCLEDSLALSQVVHELGDPHVKLLAPQWTFLEAVYRGRQQPE